MSLSPAQIQQFQDWLTKKGAYPLRCPICRETKWEIFLIAPLLVTESGAGRSLELTCRNCAYQMLFNAETIGLISGDPDSSVQT